MKYSSVAQKAIEWNVSERTVRYYCASGRVKDAYLEGKTWKIPSDATQPDRINSKLNKRTLLEVLKEEKAQGIKGGIYHKLQIELTYNSNHIEGSCLTQEQTRYIYETNTLGLENKAINVDDIVETANHFRCVDLVIEQANQPLSEAFIKKLHEVLKNGTSDSRKSWFAVGSYKKLPNEVGGLETCKPKEVANQIRHLLESYNNKKEIDLKDIIAFHHDFEKIHPFQDGNGRVGRLIILKECLKYNIVPFIITDDIKMYYYRGLSEWTKTHSYLMDTCLYAQDNFKSYLDYFNISYS